MAKEHKLNDADLDLVLVGCKCGNQFDIPWDCMAFTNIGEMHCGQCGKTDGFEIIADPSPNIKAV